MTDQGFLRRLLRADEADTRERPGRMTPARVLRTAMARAADTSVGLALTVLGVADDTAGLDVSVARAGEDSLFVALTRLDETVGLAAIDAELRSALVEIQTLGHLREASGGARPYTAGDVELCRPLIDAVLREVRCLAHDTPLDGWTTGASSGPRLSSARAAGLALAEGRYRSVQFTLDFGVGERQGTMTLVLPVPRRGPAPEACAPSPSEAFGRQLRDSVMGAPARLEAVLHRARLPLAEVEGFEVGQVIALPGVTVASVRLEGPGQTALFTARLGQVAGLRAVRLERARMADLAEVPIADRRSPTDPPSLPTRQTGDTAQGRAAAEPGTPGSVTP